MSQRSFIWLRLTVMTGVSLWFIGLLMAGISENRWSVLGAGLFGAVGCTLNVLVMALNKGRMPVPIDWDDLPKRHRKSYVPMNNATRLSMLGDWIRLHRWYCSPGDICLFAGFIAFVGGSVL